VPFRLQGGDLRGRAPEGEDLRAGVLEAAWSAPSALARQPDSLATSAPPAAEEKESPWLIAPLFTINPKLGISAGALFGYLHYFDDQSKVSTFGISGMYTSTNSIVAVLAGKLSFGADHHRLMALLVGGNIKNDYDDFLGTGVPLKSSDRLRAFVSRYLYRTVGDWFFGGQFLYTDYSVIGASSTDEQYLELLGVQGFASGGIGLSAYYDSRDNEYSPVKGLLFNAMNVAYRDWLGGEENFDVFRIDTRGFLSHGEGHVLAARQLNWLTAGAPRAAYAPVITRGYKRGQYLGKYMSSLEVEERYRLADRWTATAFTGLAFLYGDGESLTDSENIYPNWGAGVQFVLKQTEGIVLNLEYAGGKKGNNAIYMIMGYSW
jgi:hypothetical protein